MKMPKEGSIIVTYRCNAKCVHCNIWKYPSNPNNEFKPNILKTLPKLNSINITGGEPFLRNDLENIINILYSKTKRIVVSTNGILTNKIINFSKKFPNIGIRVSLYGLPSTHNYLQGLDKGFSRGLNTLRKLKKMGRRDIGIAVTISNENISHLLKLCRLAEDMKVEFATAVLHNSQYFHKFNNTIGKKKDAIKQFKKLIKMQLRSRNPKNWFRAYFNTGIVKKLSGEKRALTCSAGKKFFFVDPYGDVMPCNGMTRKRSMGNLKEKTFKDIWRSKKARKVRQMHCYPRCKKNCWMIGSVGVEMRDKKAKIMRWVLKNKFKLWLQKKMP